jgi:hypothetical protein
MYTTGIVALIESGSIGRCGAGLDGGGEFGEGREDSMPRVDIDAEFVVSAP